MYGNAARALFYPGLGGFCLISLGGRVPGKTAHVMGLRIDGLLGSGGHETLMLAGLQV